MVSSLESEVDCNDSKSSWTQQDGFWWSSLHELVQRQWQSLVKPVYAISNAPRWRASVSWLMKMLANISSCRRSITNTALTTWNSLLHTTIAHHTALLSNWPSHSDPRPVTYCRLVKALVWSQYVPRLANIAMHLYIHSYLLHIQEKNIYSLYSSH